MVANKALDKRLADIIFTDVCNGLEYNSEKTRYQLKVSHITEHMFNNMAGRASAIGKKLTAETVNNLLEWTQKDAFFYEEFYESWPADMFLAGEIFRIEFEPLKGGDRTYYACLMRMSVSENLVIQTDFPELMKKHYTEILTSDFIVGLNKTFYVHAWKDCAIIQRAGIIKPLEYHYYADWHFMRDLWRFKVADNIWNAYNSLLTYVGGEMSWKSFLNVMNVFKNYGLSTFVFRMMLNSLKGKRNGLN